MVSKGYVVWTLGIPSGGVEWCGRDDWWHERYRGAIRFVVQRFDAVEPQLRSSTASRLERWRCSVASGCP